MRVHLINPSDVSFGVGVITPRWLFVLAAATPAKYGDPVITDETLEQFDPSSINPGDVVGIGIHTANVHRGFNLGRELRERGATVIYGGIHASLYPDEAREVGNASAVVKGDGDVVWAKAIADAVAGTLQPIYEGGRVAADRFLPARWDLLPEKRYMWASVQTVRGCPKHCSFCSVWRTDGQTPRQRSSDVVIEEIVALRRLGYRFIALADDNFYPVTLEDVELARRQKNQDRIDNLTALRAERFELMQRLSELPQDMILFTQITMEAAEDPEFLDAMRKARIKGALVGIESVTPEGLKSVYKQFNASGDALAEKLRKFRKHGVHVLGSFIFGLPSDGTETFMATSALAKKADLTFAQFVMMTPFPGTVDFDKWEKGLGENTATHPRCSRNPLLAPSGTQSSKALYISSEVFCPKKFASVHRACGTTSTVFQEIWKRSRCAPTLKARLAFCLHLQAIPPDVRQYGYRNRQRPTSNVESLSQVAGRAPAGVSSQAKPMPELAVPGARQSAFQIVGQ